MILLFYKNFQKLDLNISQYSVRQATIEQIFNMFATGQIKDQPNELMEEVDNKPKIKTNSFMEKQEVGKNTNIEMIPDQERR